MKKPIIYTDGELMVKQLNGECSVKNEKLGKLFLQVRGKEKQFEKANYFHVPREEEHLKRADQLANLAIDEFEIMERERELPELYFIDFYDYGKIIEANKRIFSFYTDNPKEWKKRLDNLEPIRNAIMHCRGQYLSAERFSRLKESCIELQKLIERVRKGASQKFPNVYPPR